LRIANNLPALRGWRQLIAANGAMERSMERLSSGLRINRAGDDVAGQGISERMRTQIRGLNQSMRNILDGISVTQVAEASLGEVSDLLQRARELALMAGNGILGPDEKRMLQVELDHITDEVDRILVSAEFNGRKLLGGANPVITKTLDGLRRSWLANAEQMIEAHYGLTGDGANLKIVFEQTGAKAAWVQGINDGTGKLTNLELHINLAMEKNPVLPNGGEPPQYTDRLIAHELVHAVMDRTMAVTALPSWFKEGAAELIHGADERLSVELGALGVAGLVGEIDTWDDTSADYAAAYAAVKYLHSRILAGGGTGIRALFDRLEAGDPLDAAIAATTAYADAAAFLADFKAAAGGQAFISALNLADSDPGGIIPGQTAETAVPDTETNTWDPLKHFKEIWPETASFTQVEPIVLQIGANIGETVGLPELASSTYELNLLGLDLVTDHTGALRQVDGAMRSVLSLRAELGAIENRLEHTYRVTAIQAENLTAAESRIRDLDMAEEMTNYVKQQLLIQTSTAMLAQANVLHRDALRVLMGA